VLGHLVLAQVNLWVGHSGSGASSGLHHDFHDNLYALIAGKKRFTLYPPSEYMAMYTHGKVTTEHKNGLLVYNGDQIRADGAGGVELAQYKLKIAQEKLKAIKKDPRRAKEVKRAEKEFNSAKAELKLLETGPHSEEEDSEEPPFEGINGGDDDDDDEEWSFDFDGVDDYDEVEVEQEVVEETRPNPNSNKKRKRAHEGKADDYDEAEEGVSEERNGSKRQKVTETPQGQQMTDTRPQSPVIETHPPSFCQVPYLLIHPPAHPTKAEAAKLKDLAKKFPLFDAKKGLEVILSAGDFLYLPASWFHEGPSPAPFYSCEA